jgi:Tfp pilus assembly protein PilO
MNKLSKQKRDQLILVILATGIVGIGLWFGLIKSQQESLHELETKKQGSQQRLKNVENAIAHADQLETSTTEATSTLNEMEDHMASGDLYSWVLNTIRQFKLPYRVDIPQISQPSGPSPVNLFPKFPYQQVTVTISGTAFFHDLGKFIADLENTFPHIQIQNLEMEPSTGQTSADTEKLVFKLEVVALIKSSTT